MKMSNRDGKTERKIKLYTPEKKYYAKRDLILSNRVMGATSGWKADIEARGAARKIAQETVSDYEKIEAALKKLAGIES